MEESVLNRWQTDDYAKIALHNGIEWCASAVRISVPAECVCVCVCVCVCPRIGGE